MTVLLADIGATHARFALAEPGDRDFDVSTTLTAGMASPAEAIAAFLETRDTSAAGLDGAVLAAAGPVHGDGRLIMTNGPWDMTPGSIARESGLTRVELLNDMTAAALALPRLASGDLEKIGGGAPDPEAPRAILSPGTGLGTSAFIPFGDGRGTALASEGGHVDLAPHDEREIAIVFHFLRQFGHASPERVLSGRGLETLYASLGALDGTDTQPRAAADISSRARQGKAQALETTQLFCGWLGSVAGDIALTLGARGGVFLGGGILPQWGALFDRDRFRRRFEYKGRMAEILKPIPAFLITRADVGLLGCLAHAENLVR
jgi:glucokinase